MSQENFYQDKYFEQLTAQITDLQKSVLMLSAKVDDIQSKVVYMYAFAAGVGFAATFVWEWAKSKIFSSSQAS